MKYLKILSVLILMITLAACGNTTEKNSKDEKTETTEIKESKDISDDSVGFYDIVSFSDKEYEIGDYKVPLNTNKATNIVESSQDKTKSSVELIDIFNETPKIQNYKLVSHYVVKEKEGNRYSYFPSATRYFADDNKPIKYYGEVANINDGKFESISYREGNMSYYFDQEKWSKTSDPKSSKNFGYHTELLDLIIKYEYDFSIYENNENYYLEYSGGVNELTKALSSIHSLDLNPENSDYESFNYYILISFNKDNYNLSDALLLVLLDGKNRNDYTQIEAIDSYSEYDEHPADKIKRPDGL